MKRTALLFLSLLLILSASACGKGTADTPAGSSSLTIEQASPDSQTSEIGSGDIDSDTVAETELEQTISYDTSAEHSATVMKNGDDLVGGAYTATGTDESAIEASGNVKASVTGAIIKKSSGKASSVDDSNFKGVNSGVRVYGNAEVTLKDCVIEANAENATGVFAYQNGVIHISDCTVTVTGSGAGGVQVAGGGTLYGNNLTVTTESKAAIRSDRGGGIMVIDGGSYTSNGKDGCPVIYSTAEITVRNAEGISTKSRAIIIEGKNSVTIENCTLSGNDQSTKTGSVRSNIMLYQSTSGDAKEGTSVLTATKCKLISQSGAMFYCTNTSSVINLTDTELVLSSDGGLLIVSEGRWGKDGKNGGKCTFNAKDQALEGDITVDKISTLDLNMTASTLSGAILNEGKVNLVMDAGSKWTLTANSSVSSLSGDTSGIELNGYKLLVNGQEYKG